MEIKCAGGYPVWLCNLLSAHGVYPRSFSKYGNAYKRALADNGTVTVHQSPSGKVAIHRIPTAKERAAYSDVVLAPSEGFGIEDIMEVVS